VDSYADRPTGALAKNEAGQIAMTQVTLRPHVCFARAKQPSEAELLALHHDAHVECFIASSVKTVIDIVPGWELAGQ